MKILNLVQGTDDWLKARFTGEVAGKRMFTASEAAAMFGKSKFITRDELLLMKKTGWEKPISDFVQKKVFDKGHAAEASARPIIERTIVKEDLFPVVGVSEQYHNLMASYDGLTMMEDTSMEHKQWNAELASSVSDRSVINNPEYFWQWEQGMLVSGAERTIFVVSDGTEENMVWLEYIPVEGRKEELIAGWEQFKKDLDAFTPPEVVDADVVGQTICSLPAITYSVDGTSIESNIAPFSSAVKNMIKLSTDCEYKTDQDFADAENRIKAFKDNEKKALLIADMIIAEVVDINQTRASIIDIVAEMRRQRLIDEKEVIRRKIEIRSEIMNKATKDFDAFVLTLNQQFTEPYLSTVKGTIQDCDFAAVMKGRKTKESLKSACNDEIARCKILATTEADKVKKNLALFDKANGYAFLFNDKNSLIFKDNEHVSLVITSRISKHEESEKKLLEVRREKLRLEEEVKVKLESEKLLKEQAELKAQNELKAQAEVKHGLARAAEKPKALQKSPIEELEEMEKHRSQGKAFNPDDYPTKAAANRAAHELRVETEQIILSCNSDDIQDVIQHLSTKYLMTAQEDGLFSVERY